MEVGKSRFRITKIFRTFELLLRMAEKAVCLSGASTDMVKPAILRPFKFVNLQFQVLCLVLRSHATIVGIHELGRVP